MISKKNMKKTTFPKKNSWFILVIHSNLVNLDKLMFFFTPRKKLPVVYMEEHMVVSTQKIVHQIQVGFKVTVSWWRANFFLWRIFSCQNGPNSGFAQMLSSKQTNTFSHLALFKKSTHPQSTWGLDSFRSLGGSHQQAATPQILHVQFKEIPDFLGNLSLFGFRNWDGLPTKSLERLA